jgi:hypothetical protein
MKGMSYGYGSPKKKKKAPKKTMAKKKTMKRK